MTDTENQMGLFELDGMSGNVPPSPAPARESRKPKNSTQPKASPRSATARPAPEKGKVAPKAGGKVVSGMVPEGDVRLTANIRQDLHLKLKIASAYRRTTIGEIIEELLEKYL
ncbi:hypothetical protein [Geomonas agri]|uniref:hypothetical protein n=1 Tax=Geomonas agri TaxID=2873702 RepID=UPI001CD246ED|nr:hypothetical protein [Geomonas agri]